MGQNIKAKKHLGQHFLIDRSVIDQIITHISDCCVKNLPIIEVGPGPGVLTKKLVELYSQFQAVEFDRDMVKLLLQDISPANIINEDFLGLDMSTVHPGQNFNLVGNFPYNISSQIVFKMLDNKERIPNMVGMFQKEVADRICAEPGTKKNGIITLLVQPFYEATKLLDIGPEAFDPPPKVNSSVIHLKRKANLELPCDPKLYKTIVKTAFQQRRKKLRNTLKPFMEDTGSELLQMRPEQLGVADFINIAEQIEAQKAD